MKTGFELWNFKRLGHIKLEPLSRLNFVAGKNNLGKTSLLEAMFLWADRWAPDATVKHFGWRGVGSYVADVNGLVDALATGFNYSEPIRLLATQDGFTEGVTLERAPEDRTRKVRFAKRSETEPRAPVKESPENREDLLRLLDITYTRNNQPINAARLVFRSGGELTLTFDQPAGEPTQAFFLHARSLTPAAVNAERFSNLDVAGNTDLVTQTLKIFEPRLKSLTTVWNGKEAVVHADLGFDKKIPINFLGDGANRAFEMILGIANSRDGFIMIDEIDSGLHHSIQGKLISAIYLAAGLYNCQVFATTHSDSFLRATANSLGGDLRPAEVSYFRLDEVDGEIRPTYHPFDIFKNALADDWEIR